MQIRSRGFLGSLLLAATVAAPAGAQTAGVFQQGLRNNPFTPLLEGRAVFSNYLSVQGDNNTLNIGDLVAIYRIAEDEFLPSDAFLIGNLVPPGGKLDFRSHDDAFTLVGLQMPFGMVAVTAGGRAHVQGRVPRGLARFFREGASGESFTVDARDFETRIVGYGDVGVLTLFDVHRDEEIQRRTRVGVGAHYLLAGTSVSVELQDASGTRAARFSSTHNSVQADLVGTYPIEMESPSGTGMAFDAFVGANLGPRLYVSGLLRGVGGSLDATTPRRVVMDTTLSAESVGAFLDEVDNLRDVAWADTLAAGTESVTLPAVVQLEASYRVTDRLGAGAAFVGGVGGDFEITPLLRGLVEFRPVGWLPLRLGGSWRSGFGTGLEGGIGLTFDHFAFELEGGTRGSFSLDGTRSLNLRGGFGFYF